MSGNTTSANAPATTGAVRYMQGVAVPAESVDPVQFMARTRRRVNGEYNKTWQGFGTSDNVELKKSDIISGIYVRFTGNLVITAGTGTVSSTRRWPYDLANAFKFTANGQSNVINCSGLKLKIREFMAPYLDLDDRGVIQSINNVAVQQGTLSAASESWGVGSGQTNIASGTYAVDLVWYIPVAEDEVDLHGAIFAQTASTDLTLTAVWELVTNLFTTTGNATVTMTGSVQADSIKFSIPLDSTGNIVVPDLSTFHSLIQSRVTTVGVGPNEYRLIGQGAGKTLLRTYWQTWNGSAPQTPIPINDANFGEVGYRFGGNETPDDWQSSQHLRYWNERLYNVDAGPTWGFQSLDFAAMNAFRDAIDLGTTPDFRILDTVQSGVTLTNAAVEYVQETIFAAGQGA
jgi:hypothetical protein